MEIEKSADITFSIYNIKGESRILVWKQKRKKKKNELKKRETTKLLAFPLIKNLVA